MVKAKFVFQVVSLQDDRLLVWYLFSSFVIEVFIADEQYFN